MLTATEFMQVDLSLKIVLWIEAVLYLGIGIYELFDDFFEKPKPWMYINGQANGFVRVIHKVGHKMHAGICFLLGFVALNGIIEGFVSRFELELIFISFAVIVPVITSTLMPGRLGWVVLISKPEFWLQLVMFGLFGHLIRPEVLAVCVLLNVWGIIVYVFHTRKTLLSEYTYEALRKDIVEAEGEDRAQAMDKLAGYEPAASSGNSEQSV